MGPVIDRSAYARYEKCVGQLRQHGSIAAGARTGVAPGAHVVSVKAAHEGGETVIRIADNGPGIPPRLSDQLFEPFVSGRSSDGTGLGLTISRELAVGHGGDLRLLGTGPEGTTFELRLPD